MFKFNNKGNAAILLTFMITGLLGFTALTVDIGIAYSERTSLSNALDAAVLAGVQELQNGETQTRDVVKEYLIKNNVDPNDVDIYITSNTIDLTGKKNVKHYFAPIIGIKDSDVSARAQAIIGPVGAVRGLKPFAVEQRDFEVGDRVLLMDSESQSGNYLLVQYGTGASTLEQNTYDGYNGLVSIGDWINTETGGNTGPVNRIVSWVTACDSTIENFTSDSRRVWTIPVVEMGELSGRTAVKVVGFATVFVEGVEGNGSKRKFYGRFIGYTVQGEIDMDAPDTGTYAVKLSR